MNTYCVVLRPHSSLNPTYSRPKRYYLCAKSAVQAMFLASDDPQWFVIGVEPAGMFVSPPQSDRSDATDKLHIA
jgi:hypothetical protein